MAAENEAAVATTENWRDAPFNRWAFHNTRALLPVAEIANDPAGVLPLAFDPADFTRFRLRAAGGLDLPSFLTATSTDALVVARAGEILFETYANGTTADTPHILMSSSKAVTGLIAGVLAHAGEIDLGTPAATYVPEIGGSGYDGATIRDLIDMRAGIEVSDTRELHAPIGGALGSSATLHGVLPTLKASRPHGGPFAYVSPNTDLAGWAMERGTGSSFATLVSERLWKPMGAEHGAYVITDSEGAPWCSGGLNATARDFARVGLLLLAGGSRDGVEIVPQAWIQDLVDGGDREAWRTGEWGRSFAFLGDQMSYRAGWYSVHSTPKSFFAMGVNGQNLFVDFEHGVVVAKLSSQPERIDVRAIGLTHMAIPELVRCAIA